MRLAQEQPDNVCTDCGKQWGLGKPRHHEYRVWLDTCDVCKKLTAVCDASEYRYLKVGWDGKEVLC
jgi:predicted  nucleic acid-binding Zn ribbon protein